MIVERIEEEPPSLGLNSFNQHLDTVENMLHKMETYSLKLNVQIAGIKNMVATNRSAITRMQENEQRMKLLLEDSLNSPVYQEEPGKEVAKLGDNAQREQASYESRCHLRRTCKVTNIQEISWTQCKPSSDDAVKVKEKPHRKAKALLTSLEKELLREQGGQDLLSSLDIIRHQALIGKVNCILKMIENLDKKKCTIERVEKVCKRALKAMFDRQKKIMSEIQKTEEPRKSCEQKVININLANPYLQS